MTKLSKMNIEKILEYISQGMSAKNASCMTGISEKTYYLWFNQGKGDSANDIESLQRELYEGIPKAKALCEQAHLQNILEGAKKNWRAGAWFLERTRPSVYGRNSMDPFEARDTIIVIG